MKKNKLPTLRSIIVVCIAVSAFSIGMEFIRAERNRKFAQNPNIPRKTGISYSYTFLTKNLVYQTKTFPQKPIDEFLNSDADETIISGEKVNRAYAKFIQESFQLDHVNNTYFTVLVFLDVSAVYVNAIMFFVFTVAYIAMSEIKEKRREKLLQDPA